jgi:hypothetical protein
MLVIARCNARLPRTCKVYRLKLCFNFVTVISNYCSFVMLQSVLSRLDRTALNPDYNIVFVVRKLPSAVVLNCRVYDKLHLIYCTYII